ncbi:MAG: hypothetical protein ACE361_02990 [Aureliella sp.]
MSQVACWIALRSFRHHAEWYLASRLRWQVDSTYDQSNSDAVRPEKVPGINGEKEKFEVLGTRRRKNEYGMGAT